MQGTVKWFDPDKGYGFIQPDEGGRDVFVHINAVERAAAQILNEGQKNCLRRCRESKDEQACGRQFAHRQIGVHLSPLQSSRRLAKLSPYAYRRSDNDLRDMIARRLSSIEKEET
jgi:cold shock CspA family protein